MRVSTPSPTWLAPLVLAACATARPASARPAAPVRYTVDIADPASQYLEVSARFPGKRTKTKVAMPAWTPGSYKIREFGKHVFGLRAAGESGGALPVTTIDKHTWQVDNGGKPFEVRYRVYAATPSVRTSYVDDTHASINGASVFVFEPGSEARPREVEIRAPQGWTLHSALPRSGDVFSARDYDTLVDGPIEAGTPTVDRFAVDGVDFEYVLTGADDLALDRARLVGDAEAISRTFGEMMGGFPMKRYVFLMHINDVGGGGLEHADSTMMMMRRTAFDRDDAYSSAARLTAHEFFHLWNVKRIHDRVLGPFDYLHESYSTLLWFHEGFTETMESLAMRRSRLWSEQDYLDHVARRYTDYLRKPGRNAMPLSEISFRAWTHAYQPEGNHRNETISYYEKGDLVGIALDLEIRLRSNGQGSLPGMFRRLMAQVGPDGAGITAADVVAAASAEAGTDLSDFFARHVEGVEPIPLPALLERAGITVKTRPVWMTAKGVEVSGAASKRAWIGVTLRGTTVRSLDPGSPGAAAGLVRNDEIIAVDGRKVGSEAALRSALGRVGPGKTAKVTAFRGSRLVTLDVQIEENPHPIYTLTVPKDASPIARAWLDL
ncbi:MAG: PDZ domain-containing protein [Myxococcota bacterium]